MNSLEGLTLVITSFLDLHVHVHVTIREEY